MNNLNIMSVIAIGLLLITFIHEAEANDVTIFAADFRNSGSNNWSVNVTLAHDDSGWDHYADDWRVVDGEGNVLGDRELLHPHEDEQPFTRGLSNMTVPVGITTLYIEAHDKVHGWTPNRLKIDLTQATNGRLKVEAK